MVLKLTDGRSMNRRRSTTMLSSRQDEFLETALSLFKENGFENTSIDDIVGSMGVSKGLFYHYFESKEEMLRNIVLRTLDEVDSSVAKIMEKEGLSALDRYAALISVSSGVSERSKDLVSLFRQERNQAIHLLMEERARVSMVPVLQRIIEQGNEEGVFHAQHPFETSVALLASMNWLRDIYMTSVRTDSTEARLKVMQGLIERLLCMEPGSFTLLEEMGRFDQDGKVAQNS
ncbi:MAG: TetR/AcrR family transcriptional regulator [Methanomassiliicoccales archaeon]|nr:TetR/AcrR family transcriptional regulator [Methanomassiliicoccales archaeon]